MGEKLPLTRYCSDNVVIDTRAPRTHLFVAPTPTVILLQKLGLRTCFRVVVLFFTRRTDQHPCDPAPTGEV